MEGVMGRYLIHLRGAWSGYAAAGGSVAIVTMVIGLLGSSAAIANASMLYLVAVLLTATTFGSGPAILASVAAVLTNEWFFVEPYGSIALIRPEQWVEFLVFFMTAIVTGQLAVSQRQRTQQAEQREKDARFLYDLVRQMSDTDLHDALVRVSERLRDELQIEAVVVDLADDSSSVSAAGTSGQANSESGAEAGKFDMREPLTDATNQLAEPRTVAAPRTPEKRVISVPVIAQGERTGQILVIGEGSRAFHEAEDRLLSAAASQLGLAVERMRLRQEATEGEILRRTDELKTALLNAVSHELRTPLASIITSAGSLLERDMDWSERERHEFAEAIEQEARRLDRLVGNLLDLSRLQSGSLRPQREWHDLGALADDVVGRLKTVTSQHLVKTDISDDLPPIYLDYVKIDHALSNLIENAAKYSSPGTEILISARLEEQEVLVEVADRGRGIPAGDLEKVFNPFYRVSDQRARPQGTGLGLAVAKGMVEAHGGRLWAENRDGGGALFRLRLPVHNPI